jgi:hypothetical protein
MMGVIVLLSPASLISDKGSVDQLPLGSEDRDVLVTHPGLEVITPALLIDWIPAVTVSTWAVLSALDHKHWTHLDSQGVAPLLPSTTDVMNGWQTSYRLLFAPSNCSLTALPQPVFGCALLYSVLVTVSESRYFTGSAAISLIASCSDSAFTAQVLVILKYFTRTTSFPAETAAEAVSSRQYPQRSRICGSSIPLKLQ